MKCPICRESEVIPYPGSGRYFCESCGTYTLMACRIEGTDPAKKSVAVIRETMPKVKVTLITGLPGSGKTTLANKMMAKSLDPCFLIDDVNMDESRLSRVPGAVKHVLLTEHTAVLIKEEILRNKIESWFSGCSIEMIHFSNDLKTCLNNLKNRADDRIISANYIRYLSENFVKRDVEIPCYGGAL